MKTSYIKIALWLVIGVLSYFLFQSVMGPIRFQKERDMRYAKVIKNLEEIRSAQLAYKSNKGVYCGDFNRLVGFIDTGRFEILERKDTSFMAYDPVYRTNLLKDSTMIRTLGFVSIKDSIFPNYDLSTLSTIPGTEKEFTMAAGKINSGGIEVPVFEARAPKEIVLDGMDRSLIKLEKDLVIGSLTEATVNGNWN